MPFVHHHGPAGLLHRFDHGIRVQGHQTPQVDHLGRHPPLGQQVGGSPHLAGHRSVGDQRDVVALPFDPGFADRHGEVPVGQLFLDGPVQTDRLEEHHRVGIFDGRQQQPLGIVRGRGHHHLHAGRVGVERLGRLAVVLGGPDPASVRHANDQRGAETVTGPIADPSHVTDDLVVGRVGESHELDLHHRPHPSHRQTEGSAHDARLGHRRIHHSIRSVPLLQPVGDAEDPAGATHVLSEHHHGRIGGQGQIERLVDGPGEIEDGHCADPCCDASSARCCSTNSGVISANIPSKISPGGNGGRASASATARSTSS